MIYTTIESFHLSLTTLVTVAITIQLIHNQPTQPNKLDKILETML